MKDWFGPASLGILLTALGGAIVTLIKLKPETGQIIVSSAKDVVIIQGGLLRQLQDQIAALEKRADDREAAFSAREDAHARELAHCEHEREILSERVSALEDEVAGLRSDGQP